MSEYPLRLQRQPDTATPAAATGGRGLRAACYPFVAVRVKAPPDRVAREFAERARTRLGNRVGQVVLFGSRARGDAKEHSDYDVVVVVDRRDAGLREALLEIEVELLDRHGSLVASLLRDEREWAASQRLPLGLNIAREGVPL